jgi:hypothetical protein
MKKAIFRIIDGFSRPITNRVELATGNKLLHNEVVAQKVLMSQYRALAAAGQAHLPDWSDVGFRKYSQFEEDGILLYLVYGGTISYCLYMTHALVGKFYGLISHRIHPSNYWAAVAMFILLVLSLLGAAIAFHHLVEVPCNRALRAKVRTQPAHY